MASVAFIGGQAATGGIERLGTAVRRTVDQEQFDVLCPATSRSSWPRRFLQDRRRLGLLRPEVVFVDRLYFAPYACALMSSLPFRPRSVIWLHGSEIASANLRRSKAAILRCFDALVCSSRFTAQLASRVLRSDELDDRLVVCNPGVDSHYWEDLSANSETRAPDEVGVLAVGRLTGNAMHKGIDRVAQAVGELRVSGINATLTVVGDGPYAHAVDQYASRVTRGAYVRYSSATDLELASLYGRARVMALPSVPTSAGSRTFIEGFGLVFLEAAACGTPSIGGLRSGAIDAIAPGLSGELVGGGVRTIKNAILKLLDGQSTVTVDTCRQWARANDWTARHHQIARAVFGDSAEIAVCPQS